MNKKYKNRYRTTSHRLPGWDYSDNGYYFITLVTQNRECHFGEIIETHGRASMILSDFGEILNTEWNKTFEIRAELVLDTFVIMPNHLHAIVILKKPRNHKNDDTDNIIGSHVTDTNTDANTDANVNVNVETHGRASLQSEQSEQSKQSPNQTGKQPFIRKPKSISSFIGGFKSVINSKIDDYIDEHNLNIPKYNRNNHFFQPNYHDHIIRDENEYNRIAQYIIDNPIKWKNDKLNGGDGNIVMEPNALYGNEIWMI